MTEENFTEILERNQIAKQIQQILRDFDTQYSNVSYKKGIYIYGSPGCGKTYFAVQLLAALGYDVIKYDAGDVRNKSLVDTITSNNVSNRNVLDMMCGRVKKIAIVMDEIDGMNNGDKGGINALIKLIRQKKTKKQKLESLTMNPIICIGNYYVDKKIKELMKVCHVFELKSPTRVQMSQMVDKMIGPPSSSNLFEKYREKLLDYIQGDMRKMNFVCNLYKTKPDLLTDDTISSIFQIKSYNEDAKKITATLINTDVSIQDHNVIMNDTDRTIVALLWHENIADILDKIPAKTSFPFYSTLLDNMCFADYIDRITFQNQIWLFNEMSSLIKTFYNNRLFHKTFPKKTGSKGIDNADIRFTKVLTKYSTEYNNSLFIYNMSQELNIDKKDLVALFQELRVGLQGDMLKIEALFENYNISKLDIRRMYRFLDKNAKKDAVSPDVDDIESENYGE